MNKPLGLAAFVLGLTAVSWVGYGYLGSNPLALTMTALIGAVYLMGALELHRFRQATSSLRSALAALPEPPPSLGDWLAKLHPSLRNAVRLRIEGERIGLPGPAMTPYLVGLLVLLGMLGTFVGMVVTLNGAVMALESTSDLPTIRAALAAPVKGLGLAFGTSVAGVAASAMLGLLSALCRRERQQAAQSLESHIATTLRVFSLPHQRQETLDILRSQARVMPEVAEKMHAMMAQMERHSERLNERLVAGQDRFYSHAHSAYADLASSVDRSLRESLVEGARAAGATIQPVVEATMKGIARETNVFQAQMADTVRQQLEGLSTRFDGTVTTVADSWTRALARHERTNEALASSLNRSLDSFTDTFEQRASALLTSVEGQHAAWQGELQTSMSDLGRQATSLHERIADSVEQRLDKVSEHFGTTATAVSASWREALAQQRRTSDDLAAGLERSLATWGQTFEQQSASLMASVDRSHGRLQADAAAADQRRLAAWTESLDAIAGSLQREWQQAGAQSLAQQEQICRTLEQTARSLQSQTQAHARDTIDEMSKLIETASEAPRAAAEVVGLLRQKLSDSMVRDNQLLEERSRIMDTLSTLLDAVNRAATEQRAAIDALVTSSAAMLEQAGMHLSVKIEAESATIATAASQVAGSAIEVASLGEAFGVAVQQFSESSDALTVQLQRIEGAMDKTSARSDEQLAYYVAQAREIVDLSISSQRQIVEDLQQLGVRRTPMAGAVA